LYLRQTEFVSQDDMEASSSTDNLPTGIISSILPLFNRFTDIKKKFKPETVYLSLLMFNSNKQILLTSSGLLPSIELPSEALDGELDSKNEDFQWMLKKSLEWENQMDQKGSININFENESKGLNEMRRSFLSTVNIMKELFGSDFYGILYDSPIFIEKQDIVYLVILKDVTDLNHFNPQSSNSPMNSTTSLSSQNSVNSTTPEIIKNGIVTWKNVTDLNSNYYPPTCNLWLDFSRIYRERTTPFPPGLYVALFYPSNSKGLNLLVSKTRRFLLFFFFLSYLFLY